MQHMTPVGILCRDTSRALDGLGTRVRRFGEWRDDGAIDVELVGDETALIGALLARDDLPCASTAPPAGRESELGDLVDVLSSERIGDVAAHLDPGAVIHELTVARYDEKDDSLARLLTFAQAVPTFADFPEIVVSIAWEMVMNAMIDAPAVARGQSTGAAGAAVGLSYGTDGKRFAIAIADPYGSLRRRSVLESLERCARAGPDQVREGPGGAGIGLYLLLNYASRLHFLVTPGIETRVVAVTRVAKRFSEFSTGSKAVHFARGTPP